MINYIKGKIIEITPTDTVIECNNIGYNILISLNTFSDLENKDNITIYIHHHLREDEELYYGFSTKDERELFRLLISVSGIGTNTARMMLSSLNPEEIRNAILSEDLNRIKSIKGIGLKTAQRLILELKDKITKGEGIITSSPTLINNNPIINEATTALVMLGFTKPNINKVLPKILKDSPDLSLENIIKLALKAL